MALCLATLLGLSMALMSAAPSASAGGSEPSPQSTRSDRPCPHDPTAGRDDDKPGKRCGRSREPQEQATTRPTRTPTTKPTKPPTKPPTSSEVPSTSEPAPTSTEPPSDTATPAGQSSPAPPSETGSAPASGAVGGVVVVASTLTLRTAPLQRATRTVGVQPGAPVPPAPPTSGEQSEQADVPTPVPAPSPITRLADHPILGVDSVLLVYAVILLFAASVLGMVALAGHRGLRAH